MKSKALGRILSKKNPSKNVREIFRLFIAPMAKSAFETSFNDNPLSVSEIYEWFFNVKNREIFWARVTEPFIIPGQLMINQKLGNNKRVKGNTKVMPREQLLLIVKDKVEGTYKVEVCVKNQPNYIMSESQFKNGVEGNIRWITS